jgi:protein tyrosine phosphatase (PTP) superfamily phosphohydrolase (DUF442 family)
MSHHQLEAIRSFVELSEKVGTSGQPTSEQFVDIKNAGYELVVNLALPTSTHALPNEADIVTSLGMEYIHIPVDWEVPQVDDALRFFEVMQANHNKNIFVHCAANMRVSTFMFLYRTLCQNMPVAEAQKDLNKIWVPEPHWQSFIDQVISACK